MSALAFALVHWKKIALAALIVAGYLWLESAKNTAYNDGYQKRRAEEIADTQKRLDAANNADEKAKVCANDPNCRLATDPYERKED